MILVTGGAGYIGSHCALALLEAGYEVLVFDNLSTGHQETIDSLSKCGKLHFFKGDLLDIESLDNIFNGFNIDFVFHFAAFSQVGESVLNPQKYYNNNVLGSLNLLNTMVKNDVKKMVFSSTAAVYGNPESVPIVEQHKLNPINPYGNTKLVIEKILDDFDVAYDMKSIRLRYFNVIGADNLTRIGEWHNPETHLVPNILKSIFNPDKPFEIYGNDYDTKDGTCIRDYIDISDLIKAHILAFEYLKKHNKSDVINLGTNYGYSVNEVFEACRSVTQKNITVNYMPRRDGDTPLLIADNKKANDVLGWTPQKSLIDSIKTAYAWEIAQHNNHC